MGVVRGLLGNVGLRGPAATAAFLALLWTGDAVLYKALGIADWPWRWGTRDLTVDLGHKALYAAVTRLAYDALEERGDSSASSHLHPHRPGTTAT